MTRRDPTIAGVWGIAPGVDFPKAFVAGLEERFAEAQPEDWARITLVVNSGRMKRRIEAELSAGPARLLPRITLVSSLDAFSLGLGVPHAESRLSVKLDLAGLIEDLIARDATIAPRHAVYDLADSLAALIDEMEGEGVQPEALDALDMGDHAAHWARSRTILGAVFTHFGSGATGMPGAEARRRQLVERLAQRWRTRPPRDPVIVAGSTGSRGATRLLMEAVARLPQGGLVLPGFDFEMDAGTWGAMETALAAEDHPQYRYHALLTALGRSPENVPRWHDQPAPSPPRNRLISLSLCPAPVTDRWRDQGPRIRGLPEATRGMSLLTAPTARDEALAIAARLREAVAAGQTAAVVTPDRMLTRRIATALERWGILPDDSGGTPLGQTAPGRLLRMTAQWMAGPVDLPAFLALLKHPLTSTGSDRGTHLLWVRDLELWLRRRRIGLPGPDDLRAWARQRDDAADWVAWLAALMARAGESALPMPLSDRLALHLSLSEALCEGASDPGPGALWQEAAGQAAFEAMQALAEATAGRGAQRDARTYTDLLRNHLGGTEVQDPRLSHPDVMFWGTLEARVQGTDLVILAGLNEGIWPSQPAPDPWLNRRMRHEAGLLLPDRSIGLAAHDYQQAVAAPEVMLTRALRDAESETVPSRWLNRLTNLLAGLGPEGKASLCEMEAQGKDWLTQARRIEAPDRMDRPAPRPSPRPPVEARPKALYVTDVTRLIRDPYAIYARHVLKLRKLDPLLPRPDAARRGSAFHKVMEVFMAGHAAWIGDPAAARQALHAAAQTELNRYVDAPDIRALWLARLTAIADRLLEGEERRLDAGRPVLAERTGALHLGGPDFTLRAKPDRIDQLTDGTYAVFDYKSDPPTDDQVLHFEKQLPLEAAMVELGGFSELTAARASRLEYISLGPTKPDRLLDQEKHDPAQELERLRSLIAAYGQREQGYTARRAVQKTRFDGDFDHLARFGEWDLTSEVVPEDVGDAG